MDAGNEAIERAVLGHLDRGELAAAATVALRGHGPQILAYLGAVLRDASSAREAYSQFSEDLWRGLAGFRRECSFHAWCYRLAWHAAARFARDPYRKRGRRLETHEGSRLAADARSTTRPHLRASVADRMAALRDKLSPDEQTLLVLRVDRKLPWREVALVMARDEPALRKRFERLTEKLRCQARAAGLLER